MQLIRKVLEKKNHQYYHRIYGVSVFYEIDEAEAVHNYPQLRMIQIKMLMESASKFVLASTHI